MKVTASFERMPRGRPPQRVGVCEVCGRGPKSLMPGRQPICHWCYHRAYLTRRQAERRAQGLCLLFGCKRPVAKSALCEYHYNRQLKAGRRYNRKVQKAAALGLNARLLAALKKRCPGCGQDKPLTEYHKNPARTNGLERRCKSCVSNYKHEYYQRHHEARA